MKNQNNPKSMRLREAEKRSVDEALKKLDMSLSEYFVTLHNAFWESPLTKQLRAPPPADPEPQRTNEEKLIQKLQDWGILEKDIKQEKFLDKLRRWKVIENEAENNRTGAGN